MKTGNWWVYDVMELDPTNAMIDRHLDSFVVISTLAVIDDGGEYMLHHFRDGQFYREHRVIVTSTMAKEVLPNFWDYEGFPGYVPSPLGIVLRNEHTWPVAEQRVDNVEYSNQVMIDYAITANAKRTVYDLSGEMDKTVEDPDPTLRYPGFIKVTSIIEDTVKNDSPRGTFWDGYSMYATRFQVDRHIAEGIGVYYENIAVTRQHISGRYLQLSRTIRLLLHHHTS